jgi:hypothetical protein
MAHCPNCGKLVDHLEYEGMARGNFHIDDRGLVKYDENYMLGSCDGKYKCPRCFEDLFTDDRAAYNFLKD